MKNRLWIVIVFAMLYIPANAQYASGDTWYNNPLGFEPLKLHTAMGFIVPATAVGVCMLLTAKDTSLKHRFAVYNESGVSWGYKYPHTLLLQNNTGITVQLRRFMSIGVEFSLYRPQDDYNKTVGFAIRPFARFYPVQTQRWKLYFESGGGFIYFIDAFPKPTSQDNRLGTYWNGTTKYGIGTEWNINQSNALMFGIRHVHVSNGNTKGVERNPSHDSNGFFIGITHRL